jgi:hypothetical protein
MKVIFLIILSSVFTAFACRAQKEIVLRNLYTYPQIHVAFNGFTVSFAIRDVNRTMQLIAEFVDTTADTTSHLDTSRMYHLELFNDTKTEYTIALQDLMQNSVGGFLLLKGKAQVADRKKRKVRAISVNLEESENGEPVSQIKCYDVKNKTLLFAGKIPNSLINQDLGIDYY